MSEGLHFCVSADALTLREAYTLVLVALAQGLASLRPAAQQLLLAFQFMAHARNCKLRHLEGWPGVHMRFFEGLECLQGQRALDFVLRNQGLIDKTLLFDIELVKVS